MTAQPLRLHLHALAERLGYTVADLASRLTLGELRGWLAYDRYRHQQATDSQHAPPRQRGPQPLPANVAPKELAAALGVTVVRRRRSR